MIDQPRVCIDRYLTPAQARGALRAPRPPSLAALNDKIWPNGQVLRVAFIGGEREVRAKVEAYARQWEQYANVRFTFVSEPYGEIRIAFEPGGSWSYIGTDALVVPRGEPTMNYGWLTPQTMDSEYSRVVLHEFGHALGCFHEQQHPETGIPWDKEAVYAYYAGHPNYWTREQVDLNIFATYSRDITRFSAYDPTSIMHYPIPNELTIGDWTVGWNTVLSATDKQYAGVLYPGLTPPPEPGVEQFRERVLLHLRDRERDLSAMEAQYYAEDDRYRGDQAWFAAVQIGAAGTEIAAFTTGGGQSAVVLPRGPVAEVPR